MRPVVPVVLLLLFAALGCGGPPRAARVAVLLAAESVAAVDAATATSYTEAAARALDASTTLAEYRATLAPWDGLVQALRVAQSAVRALDASLDAWDAGGAESWIRLAGCAASALAAVARAIEAAGLEIPPDLAQALAMLAGLGAAACSEGS